MKVGIPALCLLLVACGGSKELTAPITGIRLAVLSGGGQSVTAGSSVLTAPVVVQAVSSPTGAPAPNVVLCAVSPDPSHQLVPFTPCTSTDAAGKASFFFSGGTKAGAATAEIRGTFEGLPTVFDTVTATVLPGRATQIAAPLGGWLFTDGPRVGVAAFVQSMADQYGNFISGLPSVASAGGLAVAGDSIFSDSIERAAQVTLARDAASVDLGLISVYDFRRSTWHLTGACRIPTGGTENYVNGLMVDSVTFDLVSQKVTYLVAPGPNGPRVQAESGALSQVSWIGNEIFYLPDHTTVTRSLAGVIPDPTVAQVIQQTPGSIFLRLRGTLGSGVGTPRRDPTAPGWRYSEFPEVGWPGAHCPLEPFAEGRYTLASQ